MQNPGRKCHDLKEGIRLATAGCFSVLELGCGFGERLALIDAPMLVGVDVHEPYIAEARCRYHTITFVVGDARSYIVNCIKALGEFSAILMVDFLEHLPAEEAKALLELCKVVADRIILYIPLGNHPQTRDRFGMGADHWQTHRSTWEPSDLEALGFDVAVWRTNPNEPDKEPRAAFCIWNQCQSTLT